MARQPIPPFLVPRTAPDVTWTLTPAAPSVTVEEGRLVGWDHTCDLSVGVRAVLEPAELAAACGLGEGTVLGLALGWRASGSGLRAQEVVCELSPSGVTEGSMQLDGTDLGGVLRVSATVVVVRAVGGGPVSPSRAGAVLAQQSRTWMLEGVGDRFPVELVDFGVAGIRDHRAAWVLRVDRTDPTWDVTAAVRLQINRGHPVAAALAAGDAVPEVRSVLRTDVARQLVDLACGLRDFSVAWDVWPDGSLGQALSGLLAAVFPGMDIEEIRALREDAPEDYAAVLQGSTAFLETEGAG